MRATPRSARACGRRCYVAADYPDGAELRLVESRYAVEGRGLARAIGPDERVMAPFSTFMEKSETANQAAERDGDVRDVEKRLRHWPACSRAARAASPRIGDCPRRRTS